MNSIAKRLMAVFAVFMMVAAPAIVILSDGQDSSATEIDCSKYYYNQLETDLARNVYNKLATLTEFGESFDVELTAADKAAKASNPDYNRDEISKAAIAIGLDNPKMDYYYRQWSYSTGDIAMVRPQAFDETTFSGEGTKATIDAEINTLLAASGIDMSPAYDYQKIRNIHDYVADKLTYNDAHMNDTDEKNKGMIRSLYATLKDTYIPNAGLGVSYCVVCEGYAKLFKALCDYYGFDCVIVTGQAGTGDKGPHMWNYVRLDGNWYLVDCTWDDQAGGIQNTYFLAGSDKTGFNGYKVVSSHDPCGTNTDESGFKFTDVFSFPPLSAVSINPSTGEVDGVQHKVTFMNGAAVHAEVYVKEGEAVVAPVNPTRTTPAGWQFLKWTKEDGSDYEMSTPVLADITLLAEGTVQPIWTLSYETSGGTEIADQNVLQEVGTVTITVAVPVKEGYNFKGWNTSPDGNGISYASGENIDMYSNYTLYAVWEDTSTIAYKIDSIVDKAAVFLSKETVPGVNNLLLSIGVVTAVIALLAILAISRK